LRFLRLEDAEDLEVVLVYAGLEAPQDQSNNDIMARNIIFSKYFIFSSTILVL
jgi:hypothetical protein